jgi:hypothetical protein
MVLYVMFRGAVRGSRGITKAIFWVFEIAFVLLLFINVLAEGGGAVNLILKIIGLFGEAVAWIIELVLEGRINIYHGIVFIVAVIIFKNIGKWIANIAVYKAARTTFLIFVPIAMIVVFIILYGEGNISAVLGHLLPLLILLLGLYVGLFGLFGGPSSRRKG